MLKMVVKVCTCHDVLEEKCHFVRTLRELKADRFAEAMLTEKEVPSDV